MRACWVTGAANAQFDEDVGGDFSTNYPGRYITPWLETTAASLDQAAEFPIVVSTDKMVSWVWRVQSWTMDFSFFARNLSTLESWTRSGELSLESSALGEAHIGAGFTCEDSITYDEGDQATGGTVGTVGRHLYEGPQLIDGVVVAQGFRPRIHYSYIGPSVDTGSGFVSFGVRLVNVGYPATTDTQPVRIELPRTDDGTTGFSRAKLVMSEDNDIAAFYMLGPSPAGYAFGASLSMRPSMYWEYKDGDGHNPIYDAQTGERLLDFHKPPTRGVESQFPGVWPDGYTFIGPAAV